MFEGITLPFTTTEIVSGGAGLLKVIGPVLLLALAFPVLSRIVSAAKAALGKK